VKFWYPIGVVRKFCALFISVLLMPAYAGISIAAGNNSRRNLATGQRDARVMRRALFSMTLLAIASIGLSTPTMAQFCTTPDGVLGQITYNDSYDTFAGCTSRGWEAFHGPTGAFSFEDQIDVMTSTLIESNIIQMMGVTNGSATSIAGAGGEYRICTDGTSDATCDGSEVQTWTSGAATINNSHFLQLRLTSSASASTMVSTTMTIGTITDQWDVTTIEPDLCETGPIGTRCNSDGAIYAGNTVGGARMYAAACDDGMTWNGAACTGSQLLRRWKTSNTTTVGTTSLTDGVANTNAMEIGGIALHPAAEACRNAGHQWYLPAQVELDLLYDNLVGQGDSTPGGPLGSTFDFNVTGSFPAGWYWSSSAFTQFNGWLQRFNIGSQSNNVKSSSLAVRCVRR
jgi:hypothetical protein